MTIQYKIIKCIIHHPAHPLPSKFRLLLKSLSFFDSIYFFLYSFSTTLQIILILFRFFHKMKKIVGVHWQVHPITPSLYFVNLSICFFDCLNYFIKQELQSAFLVFNLLVTHFYFPIFNHHFILIDNDWIDF